MEDKLDHGFIKNHFESPQYGESTFSDSGHVIYQNDRMNDRDLMQIVYLFFSTLDSRSHEVEIIKLRSLYASQRSTILDRRLHLLRLDRIFSSFGQYHKDGTLFLCAFSSKVQ